MAGDKDRNEKVDLWIHSLHQILYLIGPVLTHIRKHVIISPAYPSSIILTPTDSDCLLSFLSWICSFQFLQNWAVKKIPTPACIRGNVSNVWTCSTCLEHHGAHTHTNTKLHAEGHKRSHYCTLSHPSSFIAVPISAPNFLSFLPTFFWCCLGFWLKDKELKVTHSTLTHVKICDWICGCFLRKAAEFEKPVFYKIVYKIHSTPKELNIIYLHEYSQRRYMKKDWHLCWNLFIDVTIIEDYCAYKLAPSCCNISPIIIILTNVCHWTCWRSMYCKNMFIWWDLKHSPDLP